MSEVLTSSIPERAKRLLADVEHGVRTHRAADTLSGLSGAKVLAALQGLMGLHESDEDICYLEVGVFQGLTLLSVAHDNPGRACFGIDNFSQFDPDGTNRSTVESRRKELGLNNVTLINADYEAALGDLAAHLGDAKVGVYLVDGPHDYRSQLMSILLALPHLHKHAIIVVDDSNYLHVRQANRDFLETHREWKLLCEAYTPCHPRNMSERDLAAAQRGWWNGVNVLIRDPQDALARHFPDATGGRQLLEREHVLLASKLTALMPEALAVASSLYAKAPRRLLREIVDFERASQRHKRTIPNLFAAMNTHSEDLSPFRLWV